MTETYHHPDQTLRDHIALCEEAFSILQKENNHLKQTQSQPDSKLLEHKKSLLARLDTSNEALKAINNNKTPLSPSQKGLAQSAQNKIMKIFLLDRENEQLILKYGVSNCTTPAASPDISAPPPSSVINKTYGS